MAFVDIKIQDDWDWIGLAKKCNENRCHLHVYPAPSCWKNPKYKEKYSEYFELDRNYEYFHLHEPTNPNPHCLPIMSTCWFLWLFLCCTKLFLRLMLMY